MSQFSKILMLPCALFTVLSTSPAFATDTPDFASEKLSGDWGGLRSKWYEQGFDFEAVYKLDTWRNFTGGVQQGNRVGDNLDLTMTVDGGKAFGSDGTTLFIYLLNNNGGRINDLVGSNGGIDNIEAPTHAFKLYQAWIQQNFWDDKLSILAGLHDLNSEFYVTDTSGLFLNPTYGIGTEMAATGDNGPSIFPVTSLGVRVAVQPTDNTYVMAAIYDGVPGDTDNPRGTHIQIDENDGALLVGEAGVRDDTFGHFGIGAWKYTAKRPDQFDPALMKHSQGLYALADTSLYNQDGRNLSAFARVGFTAGDVEQFKSNWSVGVVASGFVATRPDSQIGFAVSRNRNADKFKDVNAPVDSHETQYELTYSDKLMPWLTIQPDLQYTVNPGTDPAADNAWTAGLRFSIDF